MELRYGKIPIPTLFENNACLVLNKPAGLPVQGGEGIGVSLDSILSENFSPRPLLVHRLDRDTSGIILVAKTREAAAVFSALFAGDETPGKTRKGRIVIKRYLGVCSGIPETESGVISLDLDVRGKGRDEKRGTVVQKKSETFYRLLSAGMAPLVNQDSADAGASDAGYPFSLLELELGTGRMHQIRRHLAAIGHPLLGDDKYGDFSLNKKFRKSLGLKHLLLHASRLIIPPLPEIIPDGIDITAPPPDYFALFLKPAHTQRF